MTTRQKKGIINYFRGVDRATFFGLIAMMVGIVILWGTVFIYPLKILVVFFHEMSHGLTAVLTGGKITQIQLSMLEGGICITEGGNRFLTLSAGYLGSLFWGGLILLAATRGKKQPQTTMWLGIILVVAGIIWIPIVSFGFLFAMLTGAALIVAGMKLDREWNTFILKVIGLTSCLYAVFDIVSDVLARPGAPSDAAMLADLTHIPAFFWGLVWFAAGIWMSGYFLITASRRADRAS